jgi:hypothetical protein
MISETGLKELFYYKSKHAAAANEKIIEILGAKGAKCYSAPSELNLASIFPGALPQVVTFSRLHADNPSAIYLSLQP